MIIGEMWNLSHPLKIQFRKRCINMYQMIDQSIATFVFRVSRMTGKAITFEN